MHANQILCPTDFSEPADRALEHAVLGAKRAGATLHLLHVVEPSTAAMGLAPAISKEMVEVERAQQDLAQRNLEQRAQNIARAGIEVTTHVLSGSPADAIVDYAETGDVDLIVTATNGATGWRRWVFGSVAEVVVRKSPCPVLVVPAPDHNGSDAPPSAS